MSQRTESTRERPSRIDRAPLLSVCTILILSGFQLGMSIGTQIPGDLRSMVLYSGLAGLVAFLGLDHVSWRRRQQTEREEQEYVENRLAKVVMTDSGVMDVMNADELQSLAKAASAAIEREELATAGSAS